MNDTDTTPTIDAQVTLVAEQNGLQADTTKTLQASFTPLYTKARSVLEKSRLLVVTDASQKFEIKMARECRLALKSIRVDGDKLRKSLKEESLRRGKAIDGFNAILVDMLATEETRLEEQERIVERQEEERKAALKTKREELLKPFGIDLTGFSLGDMSDATFTQLLENTVAAHESKLAAARKAEEERIATENARLKEEARIREENARLKKEAEEREAAAKIEREKAAAAAEQARLEKERIEAETARQLAELARKAAIDRAALEKLEREAKELSDIAARFALKEKAAAAAEAAAPDVDKLKAFAQTIRALQVPQLSFAASDTQELVVTTLEELAKLIEAEADNLVINAQSVAA